MNIDAINNQIANQVKDTDKNQFAGRASQGSTAPTQGIGYTLDITGKTVQSAAYGKEELKSAQEFAQTAGMQNVKLNSDYMTVMSNSMSSEDYAELTKDGVNPLKTNISESVTNLDKIKIRMAEAGVRIEGYNSDLDAEDIQEVVGSGALAAEIASVSDIQTALTDADLPDSEENIRKIEQAADTASKLTPLNDEAVKYMLTNDMEPTISNIYMAEHSALANGHSSENGISYQGIAAYADAGSTIEAWDELKDQAGRIVEEAGIDDMQQGMEDAKWLVENQISLNRDTLLGYEKLQSISLPLSKDDFLKAAAAALEKGENPADADLTQTESIYAKAVSIKDEINLMADEAGNEAETETISSLNSLTGNASGIGSYGGDIRLKRRLEEVRLAMTSEANLTLLKKGITIDTKNLEGLVDKLKEAEREFYRPLLSDENSADTAQDKTVSAADEAEGEGIISDEERQFGKDTVSDADRQLDLRIDLYKASQALADRIPLAPAAALADVALDDEGRAAQFNLSDFDDAANIRIAEYEKAGAAYETMMTTPRADLGDSMSKAFSNIDDILNELELDVNDANRKAVRTLGYAGMEITGESVDNIREAAMTVNRVVSLMTPSRIMKMIKEGHNPINENIYDLEKELNEEPIEESTDKYSRYLWKLEKSGDITEDEKSAYIGMYRLFNQIEKQDGKVIGNVLSTGQELTMQNMLSASRSNRHKYMDVKVDDDFGMLEELVQKGDSISEQISKGFITLKDMPLSEEYIQEELKEVRRAEKEGVRPQEILEKLDEPVTVENILAVSDMMTGSSKAVKKLFNNGSEDDAKDSGRNGEGRAAEEEELKDAADKTVSDFTDRDAAIEAYDDYIDKALKTAEQHLVSAEEYIDLKEWSGVYKQLSISAKMAGNETYDIPVKLKEGYASIHLTVKSGGDGKGKVNADFTSDKYGKVSAEFTVRSDGVDGFVVSDSRAGVSELKLTEDDFTKSLEAKGISVSGMSFVYSKTNTVDNYYDDAQTEKVSNSELYTVAKSFIESLS